MSKHTPGPWEAVNNIREGDDCEYWIIESEHGNIVGDEGIWLTPDIGENQANARLIGAAPELLAALTNLLAMCERQKDFNDDGDGSTFEHCRDAITKATGE